MSEMPAEVVESRPEPQALAHYVFMALCCGALGALKVAAPTSNCAIRDDLPRLHATGAAFGALVGIAVVALASLVRRRGFRRGDAAGFAWRDVWGRRREVPWSEVVEAHHVVAGRDGLGGFTEVELSAGRRVRLMDSWDGAEALFRRVMRGASRGAYRSAATEDLSRVLFAYGSAHTRSEWRTLPLRVGLVAVIVVVLFASGLATALHRLHLDTPLPAGMFAVGGIATIAGLIRAHLRAREGWRDEVLAVDREGIDVRGGDAPRQIPWRDVRAIVVDGSSVRLDTASGPLAVLPGLDGGALFLHLVLREAPSEVAARYRRDGFAWQRLEPTERPDGTRRHHAKTRWHRSGLILLASPLITLVLCAGVLCAVRWSPECAVIAAVGGPILLAIPAIYVAWMARFHVTVGPEGCTWQDLLTRRTFRWNDVAEARLHGDDPRKLVLKLRDGTTLDCDPRHIADGDLLVDAVRRHAPHSVREMP